MFKKFRSKSKEDIDHFLNKQNLDLHLRKIQNFFYVKKKKKSDLHLRKMQISFFNRKNSDLHLRKMQIIFYVRKNSDLHLRKMQFSFCVGKNLDLHLRLHLFWHQRIFRNAFTPACVFGRYWKFGQTELVFFVDCKIRHFRRKTNSGFILPSNELHLSHTLSKLLTRIPYKLKVGTLQAQFDWAPPSPSRQM